MSLLPATATRCCRLIVVALGLLPGLASAGTINFSSSGYLTQPLEINIDPTGAGEVDVTNWLKQHPQHTWFLTASPAARGEGVASAQGANWGCRRPWPNRMTDSGCCVQLEIELIPPYNYWNLSPIKGMQARAQFGASYYTEDTVAFTVPKPWPMTVELGANCRAMVLNRKLRPGVMPESVTLEALSQESVIGLMGVSIMNPKL